MLSVHFGQITAESFFLFFLCFILLAVGLWSSWWSKIWWKGHRYVTPCSSAHVGTIVKLDRVKVGHFRCILCEFSGNNWQNFFSFSLWPASHLLTESRWSFLRPGIKWDWPCWSMMPQFFWLIFYNGSFGTSVKLLRIQKQMPFSYFLSKGWCWSFPRWSGETDLEIWYLKSFGSAFKFMVLVCDWRLFIKKCICFNCLLSVLCEYL